MIRGRGARIQFMFMMRARQATDVIIAVLLIAATSWAQLPTLDPRTPNDKPAPLVTFEFTFPGGTPAHYGLAVEAGGRAAYRSDDAVSDTQGEGSATPYLVKFLVSTASAERIFQLARALNYFQGDFEYHGGRIANMGAKKLTFKSGSVEHTTAYNYSQNQNLQQLTALFQGIGNALEYRRRLERLYRYDKLGLDSELKAMEEDVKRNYLAELKVDESILKQIAGDSSVMNISRRRAESILARIPNETAEASRQ
jgi:hypothetical protein